jgi:hypothetical protein
VDCAGICKTDESSVYYARAIAYYGNMIVYNYTHDFCAQPSNKIFYHKRANITGDLEILLSQIFPHAKVCFGHLQTFCDAKIFTYTVDGT